jgi:uncharacterized protein (DUF1684 family)
VKPVDAFDLLDWKRKIFDLYARIRASDDPRRAWEMWRSERDEMFKTHTQSPIPPEERSSFEGLPFFDYDYGTRVIAHVVEAEARHYDIPTSGEGTMSFTRFGTAHFNLHGEAAELEVYWLDAYGGGVFLPFRDATSGKSTYGAGRYLLDTVKGADLGSTGTRVVLDFNFAYNPSCSYDPRWVCPLAPPPNRLDVAVEAGERFG